MIKAWFAEFGHLWARKDFSHSQLMGFYWVITIAVAILLAIRFYINEFSTSLVDGYWVFGWLIFSVTFLNVLIRIFYYKVWMSIALFLGFIVSNILLSLVYYVVITPIGMFMRLAGKDPLTKKWDKTLLTYWEPTEHRRENAWKNQW